MSIQLLGGGDVIASCAITEKQTAITEIHPIYSTTQPPFDVGRNIAIQLPAPHDPFPIISRDIDSETTGDDTPDDTSTRKFRIRLPPLGRGPDFVFRVRLFFPQSPTSGPVSTSDPTLLRHSHQFVIRTPKLLLRHPTTSMVSAATCHYCQYLHFFTYICITTWKHNRGQTPII